MIDAEALNTDWSEYNKKMQENDLEAVKRHQAMVHNVVNELDEIEQELEALNNKVRALNARKDEIQFSRLPQLLKDLNMTNFTIPNTTIKVSLSEKFSLSLAGKNKEKAIKWLKDRGFGGLVRNQVIAEFGVDESEDARLALEKMKGEFENVKGVEDVNTNSVKSLLKGMVTDGEEVPEDIFGQFKREFVKISR